MFVEFMQLWMTPPKMCHEGLSYLFSLPEENSWISCMIHPKVNLGGKTITGFGKRATHEQTLFFPPFSPEAASRPAMKGQHLSHTDQLQRTLSVLLSGRCLKETWWLSHSFKMLDNPGFRWELLENNSHRASSILQVQSHALWIQRHAFFP